MGKDHPFPAVTMVTNGATYPRMTVVVPDGSRALDVTFKTDPDDGHETIVVQVTVPTTVKARVDVNFEAVWPPEEPEEPEEPEGPYG